MRVNEWGIHGLLSRMRNLGIDRRMSHMQPRLLLASARRNDSPLGHVCRWFHTCARILTDPSFRMRAKEWSIHRLVSRMRNLGVDRRMSPMQPRLLLASARRNDSSTEARGRWLHTCECIPTALSFRMRVNEWGIHEPLSRMRNLDVDRRMSHMQPGLLLASARRNDSSLGRGGAGFTPATLSFRMRAKEWGIHRLVSRMRNLGVDRRMSRIQPGFLLASTRRNDSPLGHVCRWFHTCAHIPAALSFRMRVNEWGIHGLLSRMRDLGVDRRRSHMQPGFLLASARRNDGMYSRIFLKGYANGKPETGEQETRYLRCVQRLRYRVSDSASIVNPYTTIFTSLPGT
jgi:hypothetical protein